MRRRLKLKLDQLTCFSSWDDGNDGYSWKSRLLAEKRSTALEFMGNVNKRVQIHDAIRLKAEVNRRAIQKFDIPNFLTSSCSAEEHEPHEINYDSLLAIMEGETDIDSIAHLSDSDVFLLREDFSRMTSRVTLNVYES
uniref:Uncharacterized protein n=1 Tax=Trypanosoma vivax (strain Y486) TaxID=1055687 RepID=G0U7C0_TRYVY|nr:conserved hypothetical protein [Trypanosoma vivax Y486]